MESQSAYNFVLDSTLSRNTFKLAYYEWRVNLHIILYYRLHVEQEHVQTSLLCIEIESLLWKPATKRLSILHRF